MKKLLLFAAVATMFACAQQNYESNDGDLKSKTETNSYRLGADEAEEMAMRVLSNSGMRTKSVTIRDVTPIFRSQINGREPDPSHPGVAGADTAMYAVNFMDDNGFVLLSTDKRVPTLAIIDHGNFYGRTDNPGFDTFLKRSLDYIDHEIAAYQAMIDSIKLSLINPAATNATPSTRWPAFQPGIITEEYITMEDLEGTPPPTPPVKGYTYVGRWIISYANALDSTTNIDPKIVVTWGQSKLPYNREFASCGNDTRMPAGCNTIALCQILSYYEYPVDIGTPDTPGYVLLDWDLIKSYPKASTVSKTEREFSIQVGRTVRHVADLLNSTMRCDGTSSTIGKVAEVLKDDFNYSRDAVEDFDATKAHNSLKNGRPVIVKGHGSWTGANGHTWVIDGYQRYITGLRMYDQWKTPWGDVISYDVSDPLLRTHEYFYHNWGWNGQDNGYFPVGVWDNDYMNSSAPINTKTDYDFYNRMICNIRR